MEKEYILKTASDLGREQIDHLQNLLDDKSTAFLDEIGIQPGQQCFDLGAGAGSITRWLAEKTGPTGKVVAADLATHLLPEHPQIEVLRHDINDGMPDDRTYDLIHVRLVLMHLTPRRDIVQTLVNALRPGGWLVLSEFSGRPRHVLSAPDKESEYVYNRVQDIAHNVLARGGGVSYEWAHEMDGAMAECGLRDLYSTEQSYTCVGGSEAALLNRNYILQLREPLLEKTELTAEELDHYCELMRDPRFRAWHYQFVSTRGRKP